MFKQILAGMAIGVANLIPGVSGSTLAVLTNQYAKIMHQIEQVVSLKFSQVNIGYLAVIGISAIGGVLIFSYPLHYAFVRYESYTILTIVGLILGSLNAVKISKKHRSQFGKIGSIGCFFGFLLLKILITAFQYLFHHSVDSLSYEPITPFDQSKNL